MKCWHCRTTDHDTSSCPSRRQRWCDGAYETQEERQKRLMVPTPERVIGLPEIAEKVVESFLAGNSVHKIIMALEGLYNREDVEAAIRDRLRKVTEAADSLGVGKLAFPTVECALCFEEEGSYACIRAAHATARKPPTL